MAPRDRRHGDRHLYYVIPIALLYFVRNRRDLPFTWMFARFALFWAAARRT